MKSTISLVIAALSNYLKYNPIESMGSYKNLINYYLLNDMEKGEIRYKLILTEDDKETLIKILKNLSDDVELDFDNKDSNRIRANYEFFKKKINEDNAEIIYKGLSKLLIIFVALEYNIDNPQLIFESLNSTGLELSKTDLIRNYILMGLDPIAQKELYENYWHKIETLFEENNPNGFDRFIRDYLTLKLGRVPTFRNLYSDFKNYSHNFDKIQELVIDIFKFSKYYASCSFGKEENPKLKAALDSLSSMGYDVVNPFILKLYEDYENKDLKLDEFIAILRFTESLLFRRQICDIPTHGLNKIFARVYIDMDKSNYLESYCSLLVLRKSYQMPNNSKFKADFLKKDIYNLKGKNKEYMFDKLENWNSKEKTNIKSYTIEHIMPQNPNLSKEWIQSLGPDYEEIQNQYLHTIGNLTLTAYNSEYSDKSFQEKRDMENGFKDSAIRLNIYLKNLDDWNKEEIIKRSESLFEKAIKIWPYPKIPDETLKNYLEVGGLKQNKFWVVEDQKFLQKDSEMRPLFDQLSEQILDIGEDVIRHPTKLYIGFISSSNFVDIVPLKESLKLSLKIPIEDINDYKHLCVDVRGKGAWGTGNTELRISSFSDLDYAMEMIKQSYNFVNDIN